MNKDGKINGKLNIIDLFAILLVIAVVVGIVVRFGSSVTTAVKSSEDFEYVVKVESVREFTVDALEKKGKLSDKNATVDLGEIIDVKSEPASFLSERADGAMVYAVQPNRYTAFVTIRTKGKESDNSYIMADSNELSVGRTTEIRSKYVNTTGSIVSVKKISE